MKWCGSLCPLSITLPSLPLYVYSRSIKKYTVLVRFLFAIGLSLGMGVVGSLSTFPAITGWYPTLVKPFFTPPNWLFGPVWTILFILMGIAWGIILTTTMKRTARARHRAHLFFLGQLGLNTLWSLIFFGAKNPLLAFIDIVVLWTMIILTIRTFLTINKTAGLLLVPYLAWVSYATLLNLAIVVLNP